MTCFHKKDNVLNMFSIETSLENGQVVGHPAREGFKGTVMQIEKVLVNDRLCVSKVS